MSNKGEGKMKEKLEQIRKEIGEAAKKSGRVAEDITLIAVSKTYPAQAVQEVMALGHKDFGENHVQELIQKIEQIKEPVHWHFIGYLQTNKIKYIIGKTALIHSVDRLKLAEEINKQSAKNGCVTDVLIEVNVAEEPSKHGFLIEEVLPVMSQLARLKNIRVRGLMTVAPFVENPEENRPIFRKLYDLSVDIQKQKFDNISSDILSMGMSNDYKIAIEEGATMVRIGTAIFGNRDYTK